jgi:hypothetical protein
VSRQSITASEFVEIRAVQPVTIMDPHYLLLVGTGLLPEFYIERGAGSGSGLSIRLILMISSSRPGL